MHESFPNITYHLIEDIKQVWNTDMKNVKWDAGELQVGCYEYSMLEEVITICGWGGIRAKSSWAITLTELQSMYLNMEWKHVR